MSHQPFDTWLLDENNHTPEQESALQAHLADCAECRQIYAGWQAARQSLHFAHMAKPASGFTQRFTASLTERRAQQVHRKQIRNLILGLSLGLIATAGLLVVAIFAFNSPVEMLVNGVEAITLGLERWNQVIHVISAAMQHPIFLVVWILITCGVSFLACIWLFSLWRVSLQGAHQE